MKYQKGDHLQVIGSNIHGIVADAENLTSKAQVKSMQQHWYLLENDGLGLENHWMPESKLEFHTRYAGLGIRPISRRSGRTSWMSWGYWTNVQSRNGYSTMSNPNKVWYELRLVSQKVK